MDELTEIIKKISEEKGLKEMEILEMIEKKKAEFNHIISDIGAAYVIAKELGVEVVKKEPRKDLKIKDLLPGLSSVIIKAKVVKSFPVNVFKRADGSEGKVKNVLIADDSGVIRLVLWDDQVDYFTFEEGDNIEIRNAYTKERQNGGVEVRLGNYGVIRRIDEEVYVPEDVISFTKSYREISLLEGLKEGDYVKFKAHIVKMFTKPIVHYYCDECNQKLDTGFCQIHNKKAEALLILSGILDDGQSSIIFNMFRENVEKFIGLSLHEIEQLIQQKGIDFIYNELKHKEPLLYDFKGVIKKNEHMQTLEFNVYDFKEVVLEPYLGAKLESMKS